MPMHNWTRVEAGIYHAFHHEWISEIGRALNRGLLPEDFYALPEQQVAGFGPDVLALQERGEARGNATGVATLPRPKTSYQAETAKQFYRRKKSTIAVRHVSGDRIVAIVEIVSPGNKSSANVMREFVTKAGEFIEHGIHLLIADPFPPGKRDPQGIHAAIWAQVDDDSFLLPTGKPLTFVAYEANLTTRAYIEPIAVGDVLPRMPLFLDGAEFIEIPLEPTYMAAWDTVPRRWQQEIEPAA